MTAGFVGCCVCSGLLVVFVTNLREYRKFSPIWWVETQ